ncbi:MAG: DUF3368 domain-containing protein [bacterium]
MPKIISNTSCLITLERIERIYILKELYNKIIIPKKVEEEFGGKLENWISICETSDVKTLKVLKTIVDEGEAEVLTLGTEIKDSLLILDDLKARAVAKGLEINITGTLGVILKAKRRGIIKSIKEVLNDLKKVEFRMSEKLKEKMIILSEES